jgi:hypothetical protein
MSANAPKRPGKPGGKGGPGVNMARSPSVVSINAGGATRQDAARSSSVSSGGGLGSGNRMRQDKKSQALDMRFSIASVGNSAQPSLASFHSPRESRLTGGAATVAVEGQMRVLIVPFVRNLTLESYKKTAAEAAAAAAAAAEAPGCNAAPPARKMPGLAIEGRNMFVEEEARHMGILTGYGSRPTSGDYAASASASSSAQGGVPASPAIQRVRTGGFFTVDNSSTLWRSAAQGDDEGVDAEAEQVPQTRKFTGLAVKSKGRSFHVSTADSDHLTPHQVHQQQQPPPIITKHHIFIPVVRDFQ